LEEAQQRGYSVRCEWLGGAGGGACELRGRPWLFVDLALDPVEQLAIVESALQLGQGTRASASAEGTSWGLRENRASG
jgi:hypothetical protein